MDRWTARVCMLNQKGETIMGEAFKPLYTVKEAAKILKSNPNMVYDLVNSGQLPALRLGAIKIRGKDLETFINTYPVQDSVKA